MVKNAGTSGKKSRRARPGFSRRRGKRTVAIVGAGRLGTALGHALNHAGYQVEIVVARRQDSAWRAAKLIGNDTAALTPRQLNRPLSNQADRISRCTLILISTPDDAIASVAKQLAALFNSREVEPRRRQKASFERYVALHTSGALSADVLSPLQRVGFATGSLHPLVSISDARIQSDVFRNAFFAIEGGRPAVRVATSVVRDLGGHGFSISPGAKALYHAAAVTASGHVVALYDIALEMLVSSGLSRRQSRQILLPLVESTVGNLSTKDPARALTGTFARGDVSTARQHLASIKSHKLHDALAAYVILGQRSIMLAKGRGANPARLAEIAKLLSAKATSSAGR
jgi:predicted short-subunit dehydrogenase-like oxidoreductase (DUF2520 family)